MGSFLENILSSELAQRLLGLAGEKMEDGTLEEVLNTVGGEDRNLGSLATGVINVISLAKNALHPNE